MEVPHDKLLDRIYGAMVDPDRWPDLLVDVADHLGAQGGMLAQVGTSRTRSAFVQARLSEPHFERFETEHLWNPWTRAMRVAPTDRVIVMGSVVGRDELSRTPFHADVLAPQRTVDQLNVGMRCLGKESGVGGLGFPFEAGRADRLEEAAGKLQRLVPHLRRALEASLTLGPMSKGRQLDFILSLVPNPALMIDGGARIVFANEAAETLLRAADGLSATHDGGLRLTTALPREAALFRAALSRSIAIAKGEEAWLDDAIRVSRPSGRSPLVVFPIPLPAPAFPFWSLTGGARVLVLVVDPTSEATHDAETLRLAFGMTAAEAQVAQFVGSGHSTTMAAERLGIAPTTVRTHLRRCFDKTGVHSQAQLARLLQALPAGRRKPN